MTDNSRKSMRYWEIDALRGVAILGMIILHAISIELYWLGADIFSYPYLSQYIPRLGVGIFLTIVGVSLHIGAYRGKYPDALSASKRSSGLFFCGMLITLGTYMLDVGGRIYFGVLHCIGLCSLTGFLLLRLPKHVLLALGIKAIVVGTYCYIVDPPCWHLGLFWLYNCACYELGTMLDYYPFFPWIGFVLVGIFLGKEFYPRGEALFALPPSLGRLTLIQLLSYLGRHSLKVYFIHLPIICLLLFIINRLACI